MSFKSIKKIFSGDRVLDNIQNEASLKIKEITDKEIVNGRMIKKVLIGVTDTTIEHGLQRDINGFFIFNKTVFADVITIFKDKKKIILRANTAVNVDLWVF